jgi:hypothetical protein
MILRRCNSWRITLAWHLRQVAYVLLCTYSLRNNLVNAHKKRIAASRVTYPKPYAGYTLVWRTSRAMTLLRGQDSLSAVNLDAYPSVLYT